MLPHHNGIPAKSNRNRDLASGAVTVLIADKTSRDFFGKKAEFYRSVEALNGQPTAYVCQNFICDLPTSDPARLARQLEE